jgi:hypothetical protein
MCEHKHLQVFTFSDKTSIAKCEDCHQHFGKVGRKIKATLSTAPCTVSCWNAEEDVCRCSCGGKNHGIGHNPAEAL